MRMTTVAVFLGIIAGSSSSLVAAQDLVGPMPFPPLMPRGIPMQSVLFEAERLASQHRGTTASLIEALSYLDVRMREDHRVYVEIVGPTGSQGTPNEILSAASAELQSRWRHRLSAWVLIEGLTELARRLPTGHFMMPVRRPVLDDVAGEGPVVTGSESYRDGGADGSGKTIAVIDLGFDNLTEARANGDAPTAGQTATINLAAGAFESGPTHGTGCVEAVFDHAPGASYRLYRIDSATDLGLAVDNAIASGVDVITHSLSWYNMGWADNSGDICLAANEAAVNGILFFTSAGNQALAHYQGMFADGDSDDRHNFADADETITISEPDSILTTFHLQWDNSGGVVDLDFYLFNAAMTQVFASSTSDGGTYESMSFTNLTPGAINVNLVVTRESGGATEFEIFETGSGTWSEYVVAAGSNTSPSNSTNASVLSVGAVDHADFGSPGGTGGIAMNYSSQGPSNSDMVLPDLAGPTNTTGFTYPTGFGGTSCATPNAAGAAAAFWSSAPNLSDDGVRWLLLEQAVAFRDWGSSGIDNVYGKGGLVLYEHRPNTSWVDRRVGNIGGSPTRPYYYVAHAEAATAAGGRIVFLGQTYPEAITLDKALTYRSIQSMARIGP
jgi:hypothetical protein